VFNLSHLIIGLLMAVIGGAGVKYTYPIMNFTGRLDWVERATGQGSTYLVLKLFFLAVALFGITYATGLGDNVLNWMFSPLRSIFKPLSS
jgi:hypothetical protein